MVEACRRPSARRVAHLAGLREVLLHVIGIGRALVVLQVARDARGVRDVVVVIDVTIGALPWRNGVQSGQWEAGLRVIKSRRLPGRCVMARLAGLREAQLHMVRVCRSVEVLQVARYARGLGQVVVVVDVAVRALPWRNGVRTSQRKAHNGVVKLGIDPVVEAVALFAGRGEPVGHVIGICRRAKLGCVAAVAIRRHSVVLADRLALVTRRAFHCRVCSQQGKPVLVVFNLVDSYVPTLDGVALFAIGSQLALVKVGVAIGTSRSGVGKNRFDVTLRTCHGFVHPAQRKFGLVVIEFRFGSNRLPTHRRMAVLARDIQRAVWAAAISRRRLRGCRRA